MNQIDRIQNESLLQTFKEKYPYNPNTLFPISALEKIGLTPLLEAIYSLIPKEILFLKR